MKDAVIRPTRARRAAEIGTGLPVTLSEHFEGLANPTRLQIVEQLSVRAEMRVSELALLLNVSQPRMSWHLRILRKAQVVNTRRDGREVFCRLDREHIAQHLRTFARLVAGSADNVGEFLQPVIEGTS